MFIPCFIDLSVLLGFLRFSQDRTGSRRSEVGTSFCCSCTLRKDDLSHTKGPDNLVPCSSLQWKYKDRAVTGLFSPIY